MKTKKQKKRDNRNGWLGLAFLIGGFVAAAYWNAWPLAIPGFLIGASILNTTEPPYKERRCYHCGGPKIQGKICTDCDF